MPSKAAPNMTLTAREIDILRALRETGGSDMEIAEKLGITYGTVKNIFRLTKIKLGSESRTAALIRAVELGYVEPILRIE